MPIGDSLGDACDPDDDADGDLDGADSAIAELVAAFDASGLRALASYRDWHRQFIDSWRVVRALIAGRIFAEEPRTQSLTRGARHESQEVRRRSKEPRTK